MGWWGALGSVGQEAVTSAAVSAGAGLLSGWTAGSEARKARKWQAVRYRRRYQDTVRDLRLAGLNPIMAAGNADVGGYPSTSQPDMSTASNLIGGTFGAYQTGRAQALQRQVLDNEVKRSTGEAMSAEAKGRVDKADADYRLRRPDMSISVGGKVVAPMSGGSSVLEQGIDAALEATRSSALSNTTRAKLNEALAELPSAQRRQIDNAIHNANVDDLKKLLVEAGLTALGSAEGLARLLLGKKIPQSLPPIPGRPKVGF